jgi:hypothetical protein
VEDTRKEDEYKKGRMGGGEVWGLANYFPWKQYFWQEIRQPLT